MVSEPDFVKVSGEASPGLFRVLVSALGSVIRHCQALFFLAGFEAKLAARILIKGVVFLVVALLAAAFGYVLFILFLAFLLYLVLGVSWVWILLGLTLLHFIAVGVFCVLLRNLFRQKFFSATMRELRADIDGLVGGEEGKRGGREEGNLRAEGGGPRTEAEK